MKSRQAAHVFVGCALQASLDCTHTALQDFLESLYSHRCFNSISPMFLCCRSQSWRSTWYWVWTVSFVDQVENIFYSQVTNGRQECISSVLLILFAYAKLSKRLILFAYAKLLSPSLPGGLLRHYTGGRSGTWQVAPSGWCRLSW